MDDYDQGLVRLAAKAAGYRIFSHSEGTFIDADPPVEWNPLTDDGDCARLENRLSATIEVDGDFVCAAIGNTVVSAFSEEYGGDIDKTRRYVSVMVAAKIGRSAAEVAA